jgi:hypothetical protein
MLEVEVSSLRQAFEQDRAIVPVCNKKKLPLDRRGA